ncbi:LysR family transcriptional regulator [Variovorax gossypii]|nr:LysR family transcriptional regulator [Variovorax gossypii]
MLSTAMLYFRETARAGSLRRAAEQLGVAPSAISRQIAKLEGELQAALLDRRANRTTLTPAGELVLAHAEQALQSSEALRGALQELSGEPVGTVRIGSIEGMVGHFLANNLARFQKRHPQVKLQASVVGSRAVLEALQEGRIDIALAFNLPERHAFREHARLEQPLCAIVAPTHPLARRRSVSFSELEGRRVALPDRSFQIRHLVDRIASKTQVSLELAIETGTLDMAKGLVRNSDLITFLPRYAALHEVSNGDLCAVPLQERDFAATAASLLTMPGRRQSPATRALLEMLATSMGRYGAGSGAAPRSDSGNTRVRK